MAKANVIARRIRAYARRVDELGGNVRGPNESKEASDARQREAGRYYNMMVEAETAFDAFLATRKRGPWAAFARAEAYP